MASLSIYYPTAEQAKEVRAALGKLAKGLGLTTPQLKGEGAVNALLEGLADGSLVVLRAEEGAPLAPVWVGYAPHPQPSPEGAVTIISPPGSDPHTLY